MNKIKIGVFGAWRGNNYIDLIKQEDKDVIELVAICDKNIMSRKDDEEFKGIELFTDFDEFLTRGKEIGMNAVFLANYFHQHTPFAIKAMEAGMDVVSECTASSTLKECVELVEAVERTGKKYMLAENYPFMTPNLEMERLASGGTLGTFIYAEGEYNHASNEHDLKVLTPGKYHWRAWMPRTYYVTHAMGPIMYWTKTMPKYVSGRAAHSKFLERFSYFRHNADAAGMMFCEMDNGMIARFTGCTAMASDYSRYRLCGDMGGAEWGGECGDKVRVFHFPFTKPDENTPDVRMIEPDLASYGEKGERAKKAGHGGGDFWIVQKMIDFFGNNIEPFFNVYRAVAMSATAILGWRSALNHGENLKVPDFTNKEERDAVRNDDLTPFPDEEGNGITLPSELPY